jgi:hypothetical protein
MGCIGWAPPLAKAHCGFGRVKWKLAHAFANSFQGFIDNNLESTNPSMCMRVNKKGFRDSCLTNTIHSIKMCECPLSGYFPNVLRMPLEALFGCTVPGPDRDPTHGVPRHRFRYRPKKMLRSFHPGSCWFPIQNSPNPPTLAGNKNSSSLAWEGTGNTPHARAEQRKAEASKKTRGGEGGDGASPVVAVHLWRRGWWRRISGRRQQIR